MPSFRGTEAEAAGLAELEQLRVEDGARHRQRPPQLDERDKIAAASLPIEPLERRRESAGEIDDAVSQGNTSLTRKRRIPRLRVGLVSRRERKRIRPGHAGMHIPNKK